MNDGMGNSVDSRITFQGISRIDSPQVSKSSTSSIARLLPGLGALTETYTGLSKRNDARFRELSSNFPKLADWLCIGWPSCLGALGREFSNRGDNYFLLPCKLSEIYASTELRQASLDSDDTAASLEAAIMRRMSEPEVKIRL